MVRFDKILEKWAEVYKPISHNPDKRAKNTAFYRINTLGDENEFVRNVNTAKSPAMAYSTLVDAKAMPNFKVVSYVNTVYFMIKQKSAGLKSTYKSDDEAACELKAELDGMCQDFFVFLHGLKNAADRGDKQFFIGKSYNSPEEVKRAIENPMLDDYRPKIAFPITSDIVNSLRGIDLSSVEWGSLPDLFKNGWWIFAFQFEVKEPRNLCLNDEKYNLT